MKNWYIIINKTNNKLLGVDMAEYDKLELDCIWHLWTKNEVEIMIRKNNCIDLYKVISHKKYIELRGEINEKRNNKKNIKTK